MAKEAHKMKLEQNKYKIDIVKEDLIRSHSYFMFSSSDLISLVTHKLLPLLALSVVISIKGIITAV